MFVRKCFFQFCMIFILLSPLYGQSSDCEAEKKTLDEEKKEDKKEKKEETPPLIGYFSLPTSQQPSGLFGFGGNIIDEGVVQCYLYADEFVGKKNIGIDIFPSILFGVTNHFSILFSFPFTPLLRADGQESNGLEDFYIGLEYAFYTKSTSLYSDQATIVGNVILPTGSVKKNPFTGFGAPAFYLGGTYYHCLVDWFTFTSEGCILTTSNNRTKIGDQFLYQFGFGRIISTPPGWIYAFIVELDGLYKKKDRFNGDINSNSGGHVVFVTPVLWASCKEFLIQAGMSFPIHQNLFGKQNKFDYAITVNAAWSFY